MAWGSEPASSPLLQRLHYWNSFSRRASGSWERRQHRCCINIPFLPAPLAPWPLAEGLTESPGAFLFTPVGSGLGHPWSQSLYS